MRRLGKVLHLSKSGNIILRLDSPQTPPEGSVVCDYMIREVGVVNNVLGPVKAPYLSVRPSTGVSSTLTGRVLYLLQRA